MTHDFRTLAGIMAAAKEVDDWLEANGLDTSFSVSL